MSCICGGFVSAAARPRADRRVGREQFASCQFVLDGRAVRHNWRSVFLFFIRAINKNKKRSDDYIASQKQHNERVEQILERIAKALEQKDKDAV
jgi:hypothetical protein